MRHKWRFSFFSFISAIVLVTASPNVLAKKKPKDDCCQTCRQQYSFCDTVRCNAYPPFSRSDCYTTCGAEFVECSKDCSGGCDLPDDIEIRNGSVYTINVFSNDKKTKLGTLTGWYTYPLVLEASDFPIYYTYCKDLTQSYCYEDDRYGGKLGKPNCYVVWYFAGFYTIYWGVGCAGGQAHHHFKDKGNIKPPSSPIQTPKNKDITIPNEKEKITLPLIPIPEGKDIKSPSEKVTPPSPSTPTPKTKETKEPRETPQTKKEAPAEKLPQAVEQKDKKSLNEKENVLSTPLSSHEKKEAPNTAY